MNNKAISISSTNERNLLGVMYIVRLYTKHVNKKGLYHWNLHYPDEKIILNDIKEDNLFLLKYRGIPAGFIVIGKEKNIDSNIPYEGTPDNSLIIKRLAIIPRFSEHNIEKELIEFAINKAKEQGVKFLQMEAHPLDTDLTNAGNANNFSEKGENLQSFQQIPFKYYEIAL